MITMVVLLRQLLLVAAISEVGCLFYDVLQPHQVPAPGITCMEWADAGTVVNARWATPGSPPAGASDHCAQQGNGATATAPTGSQLTSRGTVSYCIDAATRNISYCQSARGVPEQVNVQVASPDSVVVGFVTFEAVAPKQPPTLLLSAVGGTPASTTRHTGVTHVHLTASPQDSLHHTYYMHYVLLSNLSSRGRYNYQVHSGGSNVSLSDTFSFRAPYAGSDGPGGATRIALFGDMGVYSWNNMQNLYEETSLNETADLIIHAVRAASSLRRLSCTRACSRNLKADIARPSGTAGGPCVQRRRRRRAPGGRLHAGLRADSRECSVDANSWEPRVLRGKHGLPPSLLSLSFRAEARTALGRPKRCKLAYALLCKHS